MPPDPVSAVGPGAALIGRTLAGRFRITAFLGEGGMATVFRGVQEPDGRDVAIKVMHPSLASDPTFARRFKREATSAARLKNPHTVQILEYGVDGELVYMVMELLEGQDLSVVLSRERRISEVRAVGIMLQVCDALAAAHEQGIVHRDLKPENIMLLGNTPSDVERIKVLDFGIAKLLDQQQQREPLAEGEEPPSSTRSALTRAGTLIGTPEYMSPEQCRAEAIDPRSDIYSCGVLLFHFVTGVVPFIGEVPFEIVRRHIIETPRRPSQLTPAINPRLEATILKALAKPPSDRQQSARELKAELLAILPELSTSRPVSAPSYAPDSEGARTGRSAPDSEDQRTRIKQGGAPGMAPPDSDRAKTLVKPGAAAAWSRAPLISDHPGPISEAPDSPPVDSTRTVIAAAPPPDARVAPAPTPAVIVTNAASAGAGRAAAPPAEPRAAAPAPAPAAAEGPPKGAKTLVVRRPREEPAAIAAPARPGGVVVAAPADRGVRPVVAIAAGLGVGLLVFALLAFTVIALGR